MQYILCCIVTDTNLEILFVIPSKNCLRKKILRPRNTDSRLEVMSKTNIKQFFFSTRSSQLTIFVPDADIFCHVDATQYHKNQIPQKLERIVLSSCTHVLFSSADTNFDAIANDWISANGIKTKHFNTSVIRFWSS